MTPNAIAILKEARHYLVAGRYADSIEYRRSAYICYAINRVEAYSGLDFEEGDYNDARCAVLGTIYPYGSLHAYLGNKLHGDPSYYCALKFWNDDPGWIKERDDWLDELIAKLEAK